MNTKAAVFGGLACACLFFLAGCAGMERFGTVMYDTGAFTGTIGEAVNDYSPLYGTIITGISAVLTIGGACITKVSSRRLKASRALIEGIERAEKQNEEVKKSVLIVSRRAGVEKYVDKLVQKYDRAPRRRDAW